MAVFNLLEATDGCITCPAKSDWESFCLTKHYGGDSINIRIVQSYTISNTGLESTHDVHINLVYSKFRGVHAKVRREHIVDQFPQWNNLKPKAICHMQEIKGTFVFKAVHREKTEESLKGSQRD